MKKRAFHHMLLILLVTCLLTTGCSQPSGDAPLWGNNSSGVAPPIWIRVSVSTNRIQCGEDLEVLVCFRIPSSLSKESDPIKCIIDMHASSGENFDPIPEKSVIVKEYDDISEDLYQEYYLNDHLYTSIVEEICIPADWFSETTGGIGFGVKMETFDRKIVSGKGIMYAKDLFYFPKNSNYIQLFVTKYDFYNRNKPWRWFE